MKLYSKTLLVLAAGAVLALGSCSGDSKSSSSQPASSSPAGTSQAASSASSQAQSSAQDSSKESESAISVPEVITYTVKVLSSDLVELSVSKAEAKEGDEITITANPKSAKVVIDAILVNGEALEDGARTFRMPAENVTVSAQAHEKMDIAIVPFEGIEIVADKNYADEGEIVNVTATYDKEAIELKGLMAGDITLGENEDGSFYFVMPDHAVSVSAIAVNGIIRSINCLADHAYIDVSSARAGEDVNFHVFADVGYDVVEVLVNDEIVALEADGTYHFVMPADFVTIDVKIEAGEFEIEGKDPHIKDITYFVPDDNGGKFVHSQFDSGIFVPFGSMVRVELRDNDTEKAVGIVVTDASGSKEFAREADSAYACFEMPAHKVTIGTVTEELLHEFEVEQDEAAHFNFSFYRKDASGAYVPTTGASIYETTYLKVEPLDGVDAERYSLRSLYLTFNYFTSSEEYSVTRTINLLRTDTWSMGLNEDGYYGFKLCVSTGEHMSIEGEASKVTLFATEKDLQAYAGKSWVGTYKGLNAYGNDITATSFNDSYSPTIDGAGDFTMRGNSYHVLSDDDDGTLTIGSDGETRQGSVFYGEKTLLLSYFPLNAFEFFGDQGTADTISCVRIADNTNAADYGVQFRSFKIDNYQQIVVSFTYLGAPYAGIYLDGSTQTIHMDVSIENISGSGIIDSGASFSIVEDGVALVGFGIDGNDVLMLDGFQGEYSVVDSSEKMAVDGIGHAQYGGLEYDYTVEGEQLSMQNVRITSEGMVTTTMVVSFSEGVATIVSREETDPVAFMAELETHRTSEPGKNKMGWTKTANGNYEPLNCGVDNSVSEMSVTAAVRGIFTFDYECSTENVAYDYFVVYKDGKIILDKVGGSTLKTGSFELEMLPGDSIQIVYGKDSSTAGGIDKAILKNFNFEPRILDGFEGTYALDDDTEIVLDGFGNATYGEETFRYQVPAEGNVLILDQEGLRPVAGGMMEFTKTFTLDSSTKTGTVVTVDGTLLKYEVQLETHTSPKTASNLTGWVKTENNTYEPLNPGIANSVGEMTITAFDRGYLSFDYRCSTEGASWDYFAVYKDGEAILNNVGGKTERTDTFEIELLAGESIQLVYVKDGGTDYGLDRAIISNLDFEPRSTDRFEGTYALNDDTEIVLDGFGIATYEGETFEYEVPEEGDSIVIVRDGIRYVTEGAIDFTQTFTLDSTAKTGTVETVNNSDPVPYVIDLDARDIVIGSRKTTRGWTAQGDGSYVSNNKGYATSTAQMSLVCNIHCTLTFDYETSGDWSSSSDWDYFAIYKNGVRLEKIGTGSATNPATGTYSIELQPGDVIQLVYTKDSSGDGSTGTMDGAKVSNIVFTPANAGGEN